MSYSPTQTVAEVFGLGNKPDYVCFGVEIEAEGVCLPQIDIIYDDNGDDIIEENPPELGEWETHEEGSIAGAEYVMAKPKPLQETLEAIDNLFGRLVNNYGSVLKESPRTSIHVHVNCAHRSVAWMRKAIPVLAAAEPFLVHYSGRHRKGNLFCLSRRESTFGWVPVINALNGTSMACHDTKYSAVNFMPLWSFGSIEFRMMRGLTCPEKIKAWVKMLSDVIEAVEQVPEDFNWEDFPPALDFLKEPNILTDQTSGPWNRLTREALWSAREVALSLAIVSPIRPRIKFSTQWLDEPVQAAPAQTPQTLSYWATFDPESYSPSQNDPLLPLLYPTTDSLFLN